MDKKTRMICSVIGAIVSMSVINVIRKKEAEKQMKIDREVMLKTNNVIKDCFPKVDYNS